MSKSNKILLGVFAFVVVCVMGYALFSETITINGTATAKGEFNITTTCRTGVAEEILTAYATDTEGMTGDQILFQGGYKNDYCNPITNGVEFGTNLLYPTAKRDFTIIVKNEGTITAKTTLLGEDEDGDVRLSGKVCNGDNYPNECTDLAYFDFFDFERVTAGIPALYIRKDGSFVTEESADYSKFYDGNTAVMTLEPGESAMMIVYAKWPDKVELNHVINTYKFEIDFKQVQ